MRSPCTTTKSGPGSPQPKSVGSHEDPEQPKRKKRRKKDCRGDSGSDSDIEELQIQAPGRTDSPGQNLNAGDTSGKREKAPVESREERWDPVQS